MVKTCKHHGFRFRFFRLQRVESFIIPTGIADDVDLEEIVALSGASGASSSGSNSNVLQLSNDLMVMPRISEGLVFFLTRGGLMVHDGFIGCIFLYLYAYMYI